MTVVEKKWLIDWFIYSFIWPCNILWGQGKIQEKKPKEIIKTKL